MGVTVNAEKRSIVHKSSNGISMAFPDPCKTPTPAGPIPIPYPNISQSSDTAQGTKKVKVDGAEVMIQGANFSTSTGDEAGTAGGGVVSNATKGKSEFVLWSFMVKIEGKGVCRLGDIMLHNKQSAPNTPPFPCLQAPVIVMPFIDEVEDQPENSMTKIEPKK